MAWCHDVSLSGKDMKKYLVVKKNMKKIYVIVAILLAFFMFTSTCAFAIDSGLASESNDSLSSSGGDSDTITDDSSSESTPSASESESSESTPTETQEPSSEPTTQDGGDLNIEEQDSEIGIKSDPPTNQEPAAEITSILGNPTKVNELVYFVGSGMDPENEVKYFYWDFNGDGTWEVEGEPVSGSGWVTHSTSYTYSDDETGYFIVRLRVEDPHGAYDEDTEVILVVNITISIENPYVNQPTLFGAEVEGFVPTLYVWHFGDGTPDVSTSEQDIEHTYTSIGTYNGYVIVSSDSVSNVQEPFTVEIVEAPVNNEPPNATIVWERDSYDPATIIFDASESYDPDGTIVSYKWFFGDGKTSTEKIAVHTYTVQGEYNPSLWVVDDDNAANRTETSLYIDLPVFLSTEGETVENVIPSENQESSSSEELQGASYQMINTLENMNQILGSTQVYSRLTELINKIGSPGIGNTMFGGECDLKIVASYEPDPPKQDSNIYFHMTITDKSGNYTATSVEVHVESDMTLINGDQLNFEWKGTYAMGDYRFIWPDHGVSHYVKLTAVPIEGFTNDGDDNWVIFDNLVGKEKSVSVSIGSTSVSGQTLISGLTSSQSTIMSSASQYGSTNL